MDCPSCGADNLDGVQWCRGCGRRLPAPEPGPPKPPPPPPGAPPAQPRSKPPSYLVLSVLVTIFCCMPLGIPAIVFSAISMSRASEGDYTGAMQAGRTARKFCVAALILGAVVFLLWVAAALAAGGAPR